MTIQPTSGSVRIIQGIGVESRDGRWMNRTQRASADAALGISDPFLTRFDDAAKNQIWIIDLAEPLGETDDRRNIPMFWPTSSSNSDFDVKNDGGGPAQAARPPFDDNDFDCFSDFNNAASYQNPIVCSLDYSTSTGRVEGANMRLAWDQELSGGSHV